ncbi:GntR family transcriptional regulator [Calidifontibacter terrae]
MDIEIDPNSPLPIYQQIRDQVVAGIADGDLSPGDPLVSVRALADAFGINPGTVVRAYDLLRADGFLVTNDRSGSTVAVPPRSTLPAWRARLAGIAAEGVARGLSQDDLVDELNRATGKFAAAKKS